MENILESLAVKVKEWRKAKTSQREPVPDEILELVRIACQSYSPHKVMKSTSLNSGTIRRALNKSGSRPVFNPVAKELLDTSTPKNSQTFTFSEVSNSKSLSDSIDKNNMVTLSNADGQSLRIQNCPEVLSVIKMFLCSGNSFEGKGMSCFR